MSRSVIVHGPSEAGLLETVYQSEAENERLVQFEFEPPLGEPYLGVLIEQLQADIIDGRKQFRFVGFAVFRTAMFPAQGIYNPATSMGHFDFTL